MLNDTTVITVNNRLAQALRLQDAQGRIAAGETVWLTPDITAWSSWQQRSHATLVDTGYTTRTLLDAHQERLLWQDIIALHDGERGLLRPAAAARAAAQARQLCIDWRLDGGTLANWGNEETGRFVHWQEKFQATLDARRWMTRAELPRLLLAAAADGRLAVPPVLLLAGFDGLTPLQEALFEQLRRNGCDLTFETAPVASAARAVRITAEDSAQELRLAADWTRQQLAANPGARIALVSPLLGSRRGEIRRVLQQTLAPVDYLAGSAHPAGLFNISLGQPLASCPMVRMALLLLGFLRRETSLAEVGLLLRSPFIGGHAGEPGQRAALDAALRRDGLPSIDLGRLLFRCGGLVEDEAAACPDLQARLARLSAQLADLPREDAPSRWAGHLLQLLQTAGWPGEQSLDSDEFQTAERFRRLFSEFAALEPVRPRLGLGAAIREIRHLCEETTFQPRSPDAPVQVLGVLEAAGLRFDAVWVLDMDDRTWPGAPAPNPLLPAGLQRELGMPHASAERELGFARDITRRLLHSAGQAVFSHARSDNDRALRCSLLIDHLPETTAAALGVGPSVRLYAACAAQGAPGSLPPPKAMPSDGTLSGGSDLLAAQSACPFRAFARYRLHARALEEPAFGPDPRLRGQLVHQVLQLVWGELGDSAKLRALDDDRLADLIDGCIRQALLPASRQRPDIFTPAFRELESLRLRRLLQRWLAVEKERVAAFWIDTLEERQQLTLGGLTLRLRGDRVDRLADGQRLVIDYKTGRSADTRSWLTERPLEPQVPLYCIQADPPPGGALIARVRADKPGFLGLTEQPDSVPGVPAFGGDETFPDWPALLRHWRLSLTALAAEALRGEARIEPQKGACTYCEYSALCRIGQLQAEGTARDD